MAWPWDQIFGGSAPQQYDPNNPDTWTGEQRTNYLGQQGFRWVGGEGPNAVWMAPDGSRYSEAAAFDKTLGYVDKTGGTFHPGDPIKPGTTPNVSQSPDFQYDAVGRAFMWDGRQFVPAPQFDNPMKAAGYRAPSTAAPTPPQSFVDRNGDRVGIDPFTGREVYRITGAEYAQLSPQEQQRIREQEAQASRDFSRGERVAGQDFSRQQAQEGRDFTRSENQAGRDFQRGESNVDRAIRAAEFAQNYGLSRDRFEFDKSMAEGEFNRRKQADSLAAAKQYADLINTTDPNAFDAFLNAGGGNIGNSIAAGNTAVSDRANLGAARTLKTLNDIQGSTFSAPSSGVRYMNDRPDAAVDNSDNWINDPMSVRSALGSGWKPRADQMARVNQITAGDTIAGGLKPMGTSGVGFYQSPEGKVAFQRLASGGMTTAPMMMVGDRASGTPTGTEEIVVNPTRAPLQVIPNAAQMPRFAMGTDVLPGQEITANDRPYLDQVNAFRQNATVLDYNPFDVGFRNVNPFTRAGFFQGRQTRYGIPVAAQEFEAQRYQVPGMSRSVMYGQGY